MGLRTMVSEFVLVQTTAPSLKPIPMQHLASGKTETNPLDIPLKSLNAGHVLVFSLSHPRETLGFGNFLKIGTTWHSVGGEGGVFGR